MWVELVGYPEPQYMKLGRRGLFPTKPEHKSGYD